ncbi:hypothetical protein BJF79_19595 [Actinomadura sp. CNU-125]|uniref:hypothetical protein n=1 Tax=Actinomadura sp. CNU-125 TaxID=1904961 RepID=UPI00096491BF|nr:hypothetical protein [Actinomadura sp. CNU-125]OLT13889.1 hypothetical protein BJF79_19595 [Actinomadura sp. CNU-125]
MDLRARLLGFATARPRAFVITSPGATRTRLLVEDGLRRRGGRTVTAPAAATILILCGTPGEELASAVDVTWADVPGPRAFIRLDETVSAEEVATALDRAVRELADTAVQWADAAARRAWTPEDDQDAEHEQDDEADHEGGHEASPPHDEHEEHQEHGGHEEHGGHAGHGGGHDGHEHHMGAPMGLPMAGRADDRDGLKLDVLHVPLGPALHDWPAGLVLHLTLQGDVVQAVRVGVADGGESRSSFWDEPWLRATAGQRVSVGEAERRRAAAHLDSVGRLLAVAGWTNAAERARVLRDDAVADASGDRLAVRFAGFSRRIRRSWILCWMLRDVGVIGRAAVDRHGLSGPSARHLGDVFARLRGWLDEAGAAIGRIGDREQLDGSDGPRGPIERRPSAAMLNLLPVLLEGAELSAARLIVASLDPDLAQPAVPAEVAGG